MSQTKHTNLKFLPTTQLLVRNSLLILFAVTGLFIIFSSSTGANGGLEPVELYVSFAVGLALVATYFIYYQKKKAWVRNRSLALAEFALSNTLAIDHSAESFQPSPSLLEVGKRDNEKEDVIKGEDWQLGTYSYIVYRSSKGGEYKAEKIYYQVLQLDLPRELPHMLFDSKKSRSRQFKTLYSSSQRHSLEGDFDKHFDAYFPKFYNIDSLSIIGPEVMHAMVEASEYDIEIAGDKLYLLGPLQDVESIKSMIEKGIRIRNSLKEEMDVYRDHALSEGSPKHDVTIYGASLRKNTYSLLPVLILGIISAIVSLFMSSAEYFFYAVGLIAFSAGPTIKLYLENKRLDEQYHAAQNNKQ